MTHPRIVVPGATSAICRRTNLRKAFLGDWNPLVGEIALYALADAQRHTNVDVHSFVRVVSHYHNQATPRLQNLAEFLHRANSDISCATNTLLARERYDVPRNIFDKRQTHVMRLVDAPAQMSQAVYDHLNPVAAGLVSEARHMPGRHCDFRDWKRGYIEVERPDVYFSKDRPDHLKLRVTPPPLLLDAFDGDLDTLVYHLERLAKEETAAIRRERKRDPMGAQKLKRLHPWSEPTTLAEPGGQLTPTWRVGARGLVGKQRSIECANGTKAFRGGYRGCWPGYLAGEQPVFPFGTDLMRRRHGVAVAEPNYDCILTAPGPLLEDVLRDCERRRQLREAGGVKAVQRQAPHDLIDEVRDAWNDELSDVVEHNDMQFAPPGTTVTTPAPSSQSSKPGEDSEAEPDAQPHTVRVKHRSEPDNHAGDDEPPNRIVVLRDKRPGRRRKRPPPNR